MPAISSSSPQVSRSENRDQGSASRLLKLPLTAASSMDGLLALLVTDIEGFTALVERLGDVQAQAVMQQHNRLLRSCVRQRRGQEVAHTGDGIMAAFRSVAAALSCARDIQRALSAPTSGQPQTCLRVRIGLHAGEPLPEEERLFGHCVNTAVRVCGSAEAGHVLVTEVIKHLAQGRFSFGSPAAHSLKGISSPVQLYEFAWQEQ